MSRLEVLEGAVIGASVAYLFDPDHGPARRRRLAARVGRATGAALDATVSEVERRAIARTGHSPRVLAILRSRKGVPGWALRRAGRTPANAWDIPMATVDIDIDQGTVTLRGTFPPVDEIPVGSPSRRRFPRPMRLVEDEH